MATWQLQEAKARLSELVKRASAGKPQKITVRGEATVVVLSNQQYERLKRPKQKLVAFLRHSPLADVDISLVRDKTAMRDIEY